MDFRQYFYLIFVLLFVPVWIILFLKKDKRKDMLLVGVLYGIVATIIEHLYSKFDYWRPIFVFPNFPFEDFLYGFIFGGISAEIYELVFRVRTSKVRRYPAYKNTLLIFAVFVAFSFWLLVDLLRWNSIVAHIVPPIVLGVAIVILRRDLFASIMWNGILMMVLTTIMYWILLLIYPDVFKNHWILSNLSGVHFLGIPFEEYLFSFGSGIGAGSVYEFMMGYGEVKELKRKRK